VKESDDWVLVILTSVFVSSAFVTKNTHGGKNLFIVKHLHLRIRITIKEEEEEEEEEEV